MNKRERIESVVGFPFEELKDLSPEGCYELLASFKKGVKVCERRQDFEAILKEMPVYVNDWSEWWDEFHDNKYHHKTLKEEQELAWGMFCLVTSRSVFNYYAIPHVRHKPLLSKLLPYIDTIRLDDLFGFFGNSSQIAPFVVDYARIFIEKIIFSYRQNAVGYVRWLTKVLDNLPAPVSLHANNHPEILSFVHPNIKGSDPSRAEHQEILQNIPFDLMRYAQNPVFWDWVWNVPGSALRQEEYWLRMLYTMDTAVIGIQSDYCRWTLSSVESMMSQLTPEYQSVAEFYIQHHALMGDGMTGKEIKACMQGPIPIVSEEIELCL